jgi:hypothetical protein
MGRDRGEEEHGRGETRKAKSRTDATAPLQFPRWSEPLPACRLHIARHHTSATAPSGLASSSPIPPHCSETAPATASSSSATSRSVHPNCDPRRRARLPPARRSRVGGGHRPPPPWPICISIISSPQHVDTLPRRENLVRSARLFSSSCAKPPLPLHHHTATS